MGAFYGSIHIRSDNSDAIRTAVSLVATKARKFLLAPESNGWVTVYPINYGQDQRSSQALAKHLDAPILHVALHDDDVFYYWYYHHGKLADRFCSCPDYFGQVTQRMKGLLRGKPERLEAIMPTSEATAQFELLLNKFREQPHWTSQGLESIAELLGLPHVSTCYEYLMAGETESIQTWDQFIHFPDLSAERRKEQELLARIQRAMDRLNEQGKLLGELTFPKTVSRSVNQPLWSADPVNGLLLARPDFLMQQDVPIQQWTSPWAGEAGLTGIVSPLEVRCITTSPSGQQLAIGGGWNKPAVHVWDLPQQEIRFKVEHASNILAATFSSDGERLFSLSFDELVATDVITGQRKCVLKVDEGLSVEPHPSGRWVAVKKQHSASIVDLDTGREVALRLGRYQDLSQLRDYLQSELAKQMESAGPDWMAQQAKQTMEQLGVPEESPAGKRMREETNRWQNDFLSGKAFSQMSKRTYQPEDYFSVAFAGEGRFLCCATSGGIRIFEMSALTEMKEAEAELTPLFHIKPPMLAAQHGHCEAYAHCLADDPETDQLIYAGMDGVIRGIHLTSGQCRDLIAIPGAPAILKMRLAGRHLFCDCHPDFPEIRANSKPASIQVWNLDALVKPQPRLKVFNG